MAQDIHTAAKESYQDAKDDMRDQHARMREDLEFSNPSEPKQWDSLALDLRKGRPCLTFDRTNQFLMQVINDGRQNKPAIRVLPADSKADVLVAEKLNGIVRHIEYVSRAGAAYDTALELAARTGLGWLRVIPQVMRPETNEQEVRILRVHDPMSCLLQAGWTEPDGNDAMCGFAETLMGKAAFKADFPKAKADSWEGDGWSTEDSVKVCEYFKIKETKKNNIVAQLNGQTETFEEDDYWRNAHPAGAQILSAFESKERTQTWYKMNGVEILEETEFPSQYLPIVPVMGYELWFEGKRYMCGIVRRLRPAQQAYNYSQSALLEAIALQPKAPIMTPAESLEGHEPAWNKLNVGNPTHLPYNALGPNGEPLPAPSRLSPPQFPAAFANLGQIASQDMEAAIGMFKANLGQQGNETSGKAIRARQQEGDTANFHYIDNLSRGIEQLGRVIVDMAPRIYDTARQARIVGEDGTHDFVTIDPSMQQAVQKQGKKVVAINIGLGAYDVRVEAGPSYTSLRQEAAQNIVDLAQGNPQLGAAMAPMLIKFRDMPEAEKMSKVAMALLPPPVQKAYEDDEGEDIPEAAQQQIAQLQDQVQQLSHALENAAHEAEEAESKKTIDTANMQIAAYRAETERLKVTAPAMDANQVAALVQQLVGEMLGSDLPGNGQPSPLAPQPPSPPDDTGQTSPETDTAPEGAFLTPE